MRGGDLLGDELHQLTGIAAGADLPAGSVERCAGGLHGQSVRRRGETRVAQQFVDRRQLAQLHAESVGTSSRKSATSESAARAPTSSTCSWSIGSGDIPAARFVTHETARQRMRMCRAASTSGTVDMPTVSAPSVAQHAYLGRCLERRAEPGCVHALAEIEAEPLSGYFRRRAQLRVVRVGHVGEARPEALVVRADEGRLRLEVEVVGDEHQLTRPEAVVDGADSIRKHERADAEQAEHADAEDDLRRASCLRRGARGHA